jgi:hypothetical protein
MAAWLRVREGGDGLRVRLRAHAGLTSGKGAADVPSSSRAILLVLSSALPGS